MSHKNYCPPAGFGGTIMMEELVYERGGVSVGNNQDSCQQHIGLRGVSTFLPL